MRLKLQQLQKLVDTALSEQKLLESLRFEIKRVLGPSALTEGDIQKVASEANVVLDLIERSEHRSLPQFKQSLMLKLLESSSSQARKLAARTVSRKNLAKVIFDKDEAVRAAVARRLPKSLVSEMIKRFPDDDQLYVIHHSLTLLESRLADSKDEKQHLSMNVEPLGDSVKQNKDSELSDLWYKDKAFNLIQDYGHNLERNWEELAVRRYASSMKATSGVCIDEEQLLSAVHELLDERDDNFLERSKLKESKRKF